LIDTYTTCITSARIIHTILIKVDWIRFAEDYNTLSSRAKTAWLVSGYQLANPAIFAHLDPAEAKQTLQEYSDEFKIWKRLMGKHTTARNRLYQLFVEV
jgi:hypothetical protein